MSLAGIPDDVRELFHRAAESPSEPPAPAADFSPVLTCLADAESKKINWLWRGRIAAGRITLLVGRPGEGKSFLTCDLAARVSTGSAFPDGSPCARGSVLLMTAEDDPADTIRPRLDAAGADCSRVHLLRSTRGRDEQGEYERLVNLADIGVIEMALDQLPDYRLLIIDPIGSYLPGRTDAHRDNEVREVLAPVAALAEKRGVAVLIVMHTRKAAANYADDLALGSRAFTGLARTAWHLSKDRENPERRLLLPGKSNLARQQAGLAFTIEGDDQGAHLVWEGAPVNMSADDFLALQAEASKRGPKPVVQTEAMTWLQAALADGPRLARDLFAEWEETGGSVETLKKAKKSLGVESFREPGKGPWWWRIPEGLVSTQLKKPDILYPLDPLADDEQLEVTL